ncbi:hypothetical protein PR048_021023, partial [Dryococelus australis]
MIDLKTLAPDLLKNKSIIIEGNRYNHEYPEFRTIRTTGRGHPPSIPANMPTLYKTQLPIPASKKQDLLQLCTANVISVEFHGWYKSLPADTYKKDYAPEPSSISDDSDES